MENSEFKSLADYVGAKDPRLVHLELYVGVSNYESFLSAIHYALETIIRPMLESTRHTIQKNEDDISNQIVNLLKLLYYQASREESSNGNVDITIRLGEFTWLAEAKIYSNNTVLMDGFRQLATRYSRVSPNGNSSGGYLVYNFRRDTLALLKEYKEKSKPIFEGEFENFSISDCSQYQYQFYTSHKDAATGLIYTVKYIPFSFYFAPDDRSGKATAVRKQMKASSPPKKAKTPPKKAAKPPKDSSA